MHALVSDPGGDLDTCHSVSRSTAFRFPETVGFHFQYTGSYHQTTTIDLSGLNTEPTSLIHLASDSRYRAYPQTSLLTCRLGFGQVGLVAIAATHPLVRNNQFLPRMGLPRLWIYLGTTGRILKFPKLTFPITFFNHCPLFERFS